VLAPLGRRRVEVTRNIESGAYRIFTALDRDGPAPRAGQFYMLAAVERWATHDGRPFLPRAFSVAMSAAEDRGVRLDFLVEGIGPGTERLAALGPGEGLWIAGPLGRPFSPPDQLGPAVGAILVGGGIGVAPLAIWRRQLAEAGVPARVLLGFRDRAHTGGLDLFASEREAPQGEGVAGQDDSGPSAKLKLCPEVRLASEDGHIGHRGYVTDLLSVLLEGDQASTAAVYACGPPAMLEAVRTMCARRGISAELAMEAPMACGFGACMGCAIPLADGGYMRLCVDGPVVEATRIETALVPGSGH
jgi:dihydroorotate dehydrogenase electron transfer subunit